MPRVNHKIEALEEQALGLTLGNIQKSRVVNPDPNDVPTIDELEDLYNNGEISADEFLYYIYYFYPSVWLEERMRSPIDPSKYMELWSHQIMVLDDPSPQKALRFGRQIGKCVHSDTLIILGNGELKRAEDIYNESKSFKILSWNESTYQLEVKDAKIDDNGYKPIIEITSKSGYKTKVTHEHPFLVYDGSKFIWKKAIDIQEGEKVAVLNSLYNIFNFDLSAIIRDINEIWSKNGYIIYDNNVFSIGLVYDDYDEIEIKKIQYKLLLLGIKSNFVVKQSKLYKKIYNTDRIYGLTITDNVSIYRILKYILYNRIPGKLRYIIDKLDTYSYNNYHDNYIIIEDVIKVKKYKKKYKTYSISVDDNHTLTTDFFITHNSTTIVLKALHIITFNDNRRVVFYAPQQKHIDNLFGELDKYINLCDDIVNLVNKRNISEDDLQDARVALVTSTKRPQIRKFSNGSSIEGVILANSPDQMGLSARGISATDVFFDEAAFIHSGAFSAALLTTRSFIRPTIWISSTPTIFGLKFREMCQSPNFKEFHISAEEADNWTPELEAFYKSNLTKEEYELDIKANWSETNEGVFKLKYIQMVPQISILKFDDINRQYSYMDVRSMLETDMFKYIVFGVDWNKPKQGTRIIVMGVTSDLRVYILESNRVSADLGYLYAIDEIVRLDNKYNQQAYIFVDEGYGDFPTEELHLIGVRDKSGLNERVIPVPTNSSIEVTDIFTGMKRSEPVNVVVTKTTVLYLERGWIHWPVEENVVDDTNVLTKLKKEGKIPIGNAMESYIIDRYTPNGRPIYKSTIGDDHSLNAFMYGIFGINNNIRPAHLVDDVLIEHTGNNQTVIIKNDPMSLSTMHTVSVYNLNKHIKNNKNMIVDRYIYNNNIARNKVRRRSLW